MHLTDVNKILKVFNSKDWSEYYEYVNIPKLVNEEQDQKYANTPKKNIWFKIFKTLDEKRSLKEFEFVKDIIQSEIKKINSNYLLSDYITFLIYEKGDFFAEHSDGLGIPPNKTKKHNTILSGGYLLNNDYEGGDFIIDGKKLNVDIGELFYFGRDTLHEITEVKSGIRYSLHFGIDKAKHLI